MSQEKVDQAEYETELKLAAVRRVLAGESVSAVAGGVGHSAQAAVRVERPLCRVRRSGPDESARGKAAQGSDRSGKRERAGGERTRGVAGGAEADRGTGTQSGAAGTGTGFFRRSLAAHKSGREAICTLIAKRAGQGGLSVERMCELSGVSRAGFYRHWEESSPRQADTAMRDEMQRVVVENRFYGYRRVQQEMRHRGHW